MAMKEFLLPAVGLAILMSAGFSGNAAAQDCREHCLHNCALPNNYQSSGISNPNGWGGACSYLFCSGCGESAVKDHVAVAEVILEEVREGSPSDVKAVVTKYGKYMLINVDRGLLVLKGLGCDPEGLGAVVPLSPEKIDAVRKAGVQDLAEFISTRASAPTKEGQG